jgi:hypothetical protein
MCHVVDKTFGLLSLFASSFAAMLAATAKFLPSAFLPLLSLERR